MTVVARDGRHRSPGGRTTSVFADLALALVDLVEALADLQDTVEHGP